MVKSSLARIITGCICGTEVLIVLIHFHDLFQCGLVILILSLLSTCWTLCFYIPDLATVWFFVWISWWTFIVLVEDVEHRLTLAYWGLLPYTSSSSTEILIGISRRLTQDHSIEKVWCQVVNLLLGLSKCSSSGLCTLRISVSVSKLLLLNAFASFLVLLVHGGTPTVLIRALRGVKLQPIVSARLFLHHHLLLLL